MFEIRSDRRPLASQVRDRIREMLREKYYRAGDQIPSEEILAATFGVSRATLREALKTLEEERVILCRHGAGRFVASDPSSTLYEEVTRLQSVTEMAHGLDIPIHTRVLSMRRLPADDLVRARLDLEDGSPVFRLERARLAKDETIIYSVDIFPNQLVKGEVLAEMFNGSLVQIMEKEWGTHLAYSKTTISAVLLEDDLCLRLKVRGNQPWILMEQVNYNDHDRPILYSRDYHRGDKFQFHVLRRRR